MQKTKDKSNPMWQRSYPLKSAFLMLSIATGLSGQSFSSGSTGADGDLIVNTPGTTTFTATPLGGGSVYNFKSIQIAAGSTLRLSGAVFSGPLYLLAQNAVTVAGTIDLSGAMGSVPTSAAQRNGPTDPGAGGYGGGAAFFAGNPATAGLGPGAGPFGCAGGVGPVFTGNQFLVPLIGGSGGTGGHGSGGAGGGALLIASSVSIAISGTITARGGDGVYDNAGSWGAGVGGGVRLVAPTITGAGTVNAAKGNNGCTSDNGIVRMESYQNTFTGTIGGNLYLATPVNLFLPSLTAQPSIMVTSVGGVTVPPNPSGSFTVPDVTLNSGSPLAIAIQAKNIPVGTIPTIYFLTENFPDQQILTTALAGTLASSTATAIVTLNPGFSKGYIIATWTQ